MHIVYRVEREYDHQFVSADKENIPSLDGSSEKEKWTPIQVYNVMPLLKATDCYNQRGEGLILSERAVQIFEHEIANFATMYEALPLICDEPYCPDEPLYVLNVMHIVDCQIHRHKSLHLQIRETRFSIERLPEPGFLFKTPEHQTTATHMYVDTDNPVVPFKDVIEKHGIRGIRFEEIWRSE